DVGRKSDGVAYVRPYVGQKRKPQCDFFFQAEDGIRDGHVTGVQTCALPISDHFERLLAQVVRLFGVEGEDLPGDFALGNDERGDGPRPEPAHRLEAVAAVRGPETSFRRGDGDHRVEKHSRAVEDVGELAVVRLRKVALEGRRLDALDRKNREDERVLPERIAVGAENEAPFALYPSARFLGV